MRRDQSSIHSYNSNQYENEEDNIKNQEENSSTISIDEDMMNNLLNIDTFKSIIGNSNQIEIADNHHHNEHIISSPSFSFSKQENQLMPIEESESVHDQNEWTEEEDLLLNEAYQKYHRNWTKISKIIKNKTPRQCSYRYDKLFSKSAYNQREFKRIDDICLIDLIKEHGHNWAIIQEKMPLYTIDQLRQRFNKRLLPKIFSKTITSQKEMSPNDLKENKPSLFYLNKTKLKDNLINIIQKYTQFLDKQIINCKNLQNLKEKSESPSNRSIDNTEDINIYSNESQVETKNKQNINAIYSQTRRLKNIFKKLNEKNLKIASSLNCVELYLFNCKMNERQNNIFGIINSLMSNIVDKHKCNYSTVLNIMNIQSYLICLGKLSIRLYQSLSKYSNVVTI